MNVDTNVGRFYRQLYYFVLPEHAPEDTDLQEPYAVTGSCRSQILKVDRFSNLLTGQDRKSAKN